MDYTTQYIGIFISQYKDPYKPTSIMERRRVFFVAQFSTAQDESQHPKINTSIEKDVVFFRLQ